MSMIQVRDADKYYNKGKSNQLHVINHVSLELPDHGMVAIFGKSGCGKTTLLNAIGGLDKLNSGSISFLGENISKNPDDVRNAYIGYIFQNYNLNKNETVFENVADALLLCGMQDKEEIRTRVIAALANVEMDKFRDRYPDTLSGGQQQRVAIARALVKNPAVILADEPTGNLDESNTVLVMDILKELSKQSLVLLVTHEANLVDFYCDNVVEIIDGKIANIRINEQANGYIQKNKNDIYLGELEQNTADLPGLKISYYGDTDKEIKLSIVNYHGKLYLKSETPELKFLDDTSEVHLRQGVYTESAEAKALESKHLDFSKLPKFQGSHYGKLFHLKNSIKLAFRSIYAGTSKKKGKRLLRVSMILLSVVMVFLSAVFGVNIKKYVDISKEHNANLFYLPLDGSKDYSALSEHIGEHGIDYARIIGSGPNSTETFQFQASHFMTASIPELSATGNIMDASLATDMPLLAGNKDFSAPCDVIITSALADELIASASVSYLSEYNDIVGLISSETYLETEHLRIIGVVKSAEKNFYFNGIYASYLILHNDNNNLYLYGVSALSLQNAYDGTLHDGEVVIAPLYHYSYSGDISEEDAYQVGESLQIFGKTFRIAKILHYYTNPYDFESYYQQDVGKSLPTETEWWSSTHSTALPEAAILKAEYFFNFYLPAYWNYIDLVKTSQESYNLTPADLSVWMLSKDHNLYDYLYWINSDWDLYASRIFYEQNGRFPTQTELNAVDNAQIQAKQNAVEQRMNQATTDYDNYQTYFYKSTVFQSSAPSVILTDSDYQKLLHCAGPSTAELNIGAFYVWNGFGDAVYYANYMLIHASNVAEAREYLSSAFGDDLETPEEVFAQNLSIAWTSIVTGAIVISVLLALLCLCIFFIMRSSFMTRVKEIGIMRAVGVSKKNMIFRFGVEAAILGLFTVAVGFFASWWFIASLSKSQLFSQFFYFPAWFATSALVILLAATLFFGILPAILLLRKTPSEILSKYDI